MDAEKEQSGSILTDRYQNNKDFHRKLEDRILKFGRQASQILEQKELGVLYSSLDLSQQTLLRISIAAEIASSDLYALREQETKLSSLHQAGDANHGKSRWVITPISRWILKTVAGSIANEKLFQETVVSEIAERKKRISRELYPGLNEDQRYRALRKIELAGHEIFTITSSQEKDRTKVGQSLSEAALFWKKRLVG